MKFETSINNSMWLSLLAAYVLALNSKFSGSHDLTLQMYQLLSHIFHGIDITKHLAILYW